MTYYLRDLLKKMSYPKSPVFSLREMMTSDRNDFEEMKKMYEEEVSQYCEDRACIWEWDDFYFKSNRQGYMIEMNLQMRLINVGFILCDYKNYVFDDGCYISQFYVKENCRRLRAGYVAMTYLAKKESRIMMHVIRENKPAQCFWKTIMPQLGFDNYFDKNNLKVTSEGDVCDYFYWKKETNEDTMYYVKKEYLTGTPFVAGGEIYNDIYDLVDQELELFENTYYDVYGRIVVKKNDVNTDQSVYIILAGEDFVQVYEDRRRLYVLTAEEIMDVNLLVKAMGVKRYMDENASWEG